MSEVSCCLCVSLGLPCLQCLSLSAAPSSACPSRPGSLGWAAGPLTPSRPGPSPPVDALCGRLTPPARMQAPQVQGPQLRPPTLRPPPLLSRHGTPGQQEARKLLKQKVAKGSIQKGLAQKMRIHGEAGCGAGKEKPGQTFPALIQNKVQAPPSSPRHKNEN